MKLSELSGTHIGSTVRIKTTDGVIEGVLYGVSHQADKISESVFLGPERYTPGSARVDVEVGAAAGRDLDPLFDVEIVKGA